MRGTAFNVAISSALLFSAAGLRAEAAADGAPATVALPETAIDSTVLNQRPDAFTAYGPAQVTKSATPLAETAHSITVVSRAQLDSQQAMTLNDALQGVPGVIAGQYGRRGMDDLIIRGQVASDSLFLDGLRTAATNFVAEQPYGLEQVEVLKGPASLLYGLVMPGGVANMVSKRPQADPFAKVDLTYGSYDLHQEAFDIGTPLSDNGKAAIRVNGLSSRSKDATDHVWFKSSYIAPSLSLDLGEDTDFMILASHQDRSYVRQQGLPLAGSLTSNPNGRISRHLFTGEPGQPPYHGTENRLGYTLTHRLANDWVYHQDLRWQDFSLSGQLTANGVLSATDNRTLNRSITDQQFSGDTISFDNNLQRIFDTGWGQHELTMGVDYLRSRVDQTTKTCTVGKLDVYDPTYGSAIVCPITPRTQTDTTVRMLGTYVRDNLKLGEKWNLSAGLRRDTTATYALNELTDSRGSAPANATTGSAAVMYELFDNVRPYLSYSTSFYPNTGTDVNGKSFKPEKGRQWEAGIKYDLDPGRTLLTFSLFDLRRQNVLEDDPANDGYSVAIGEQRTRGAEVDVTSDLTERLSLSGGYAYTQAVITDDGGATPSTVGERLDNVPRQTASLFARYRLSDELGGWAVNAGWRGADRNYTNGYYIPGYGVTNVGLTYETTHWHTALTAKNVFDKHYYTGGLARAVALGDDRTVLFSVGYRY